MPQSTWIGSYTATDKLTHLDSPYQVIQGQWVQIDSSGGAFTALAPLSPLKNSVFAIQATTEVGFDITIDGNGFNVRNVLDGYKAQPSISGFDALFGLVFFFDGTLWEGLSTQSASRRPVIFSNDVQTAGTSEVLGFQFQRYDPTAGGLVIEAPSNPFFREKFGIVNTTASAISVTIDGNGSQIQDPSFNLVASFPLMAANARILYEFDGTNWVVLSRDGAVATGLGNYGSIVRPFNGTTDVTYAAGWNAINEFTEETDGIGVDADFATGTVTINKIGSYRITGQSTLGSKNGSRTDLSIGIGGVPAGDRWTASGAGLDEPTTFRPEVTQLDVGAVPVVVTLLVQNSAPGNKDIRHYSMDLFVMEL